MKTEAQRLLITCPMWSYSWSVPQPNFELYSFCDVPLCIKYPSLCLLHNEVQAGNTVKVLLLLMQSLCAMPFIYIISVNLQPPIDLIQDEKLFLSLEIHKFWPMTMWWPWEQASQISLCRGHNWLWAPVTTLWNVEPAFALRSYFPPTTLNDRVQKGH